MHAEEKNCLVKLWSKAFDRNEIANYPKNEGIREHLVTLDIPEEIRADGNYMLKLQVVAKSGSWKSNWGFEGFGVT